MARDYAKYNSKRRVADNKNRSPDIFIIITLLVVIVIGSYWVYTHKIKGAFTQNSQLAHAITNLKAFFHHKKPEMDAAVSQHTQSIMPQDEVRFDFYNELPNMRVPTTTTASYEKKAKVNLAAANIPTVATAKLKEKPGYHVHLGHFNDVNSASEMRISLLLMGIDADIVKVGNQFHLQRGPYPTLVQAKDMQKKLQHKGFESTLQQSQLIS
jgi:hypothetical protein